MTIHSCSPAQAPAGLCPAGEIPATSAPGAARPLPSARHRCAVTCCAPRRACGNAFSLATAAPSRGSGRSPLARLTASGGPRRGAGSAFSWPTAFRFALQSRPSLLSRSPSAGLDRARCALQGVTPAGAGCAISSPFHGSGNARRRIPRCHASLRQPETPPAPLRGRSLRSDL